MSNVVRYFGLCAIALACVTGTATAQPRPERGSINGLVVFADGGSTLRS